MQPSYFTLDIKFKEDEEIVQSNKFRLHICVEAQIFTSSYRIFINRLPAEQVFPSISNFLLLIKKL